jgi:hypothetical protein
MKRILIQLSLIVLLSGGIFLLSCGSDSDPTGPGAGPEPAPSVLPPDPDGMLLDGAADDPATAATEHLAPSPVAAAQIADRLLTTRLAAVIAPGTTVGEVNAALADHDAAIVSMLAGLPNVTLVIPAVADRAAAEALAADLVATGAFAHARPAFAATRAMDSESDADKDLPDAEVAARTPHALPMRLPAAWNLREAATDEAVLVHPNWYADFAGYSEIPQLAFGSFGQPIPASNPDHAVGSLGYYMLGVAAADWEFDPLTSPHTGTDAAAADALAVLGVHTYGLDVGDQLAMISLALLLDLPADPARVVLLDTESFDDPEFAYFRFIDRAWLALQWRQTVHNTSPIGDAFVHVAAAGETRHVNDPYDDAILNSTAGVATLPDLRAVALLDASPEEYEAFTAAYDAAIAQESAIAQPLTNVLIVGSSDAAGNESSFSAPGSDVRVVGEGVIGPCLEGEQCDGVSIAMNNTAAAAAQVAGLACYLWHLDGSLTPDDLLLRLQHAYSASGTPGILDASIAALSMERAGGGAELRKLLLDVDGPAGEPDGVFTEHDIEKFLEAFEAFAGASAPDYSVYDLNGDGWTAGVGAARMDLDVNDLPGFSEVEQTIGVSAISFDETAVTDEEVLCYYAWSDLYTGDEAARASLLDCGGEGLFVEIAGFPDRASPGESVLVTVTAGFDLPDGGVAYEPGIEIDFEYDGLEVEPRSGVTDALGTFEATVTFDDDENWMTLLVWAESADEAQFTEVTALRNDEIELVERYVYVDASVFSVYSPGPGIPSEEIVNLYDFADIATFEDFAEQIRVPAGGGMASGSGGGMSVSGMALSDLTTTVDSGPGSGFSGLTFTGETSGSITLSNPNLQLPSYQASARAVAEVDVTIVVWGEPAIYNLQGSVDSQSYDIEFEGSDGDLYECDSVDAPCTSISSSGTLPPGEYDLDLYIEDGGWISWDQDCNDCTTSGAHESNGFLDVTFEVFHAGK